LTRLLSRIVVWGCGMLQRPKRQVVTIPEISEHPLRISAKAKILSFPGPERRPNAGISGPLEVFDSGGCIFFRESADTEASLLHSVKARVLKFARVRAR
jgi:hypothetical protein